MLWDTAHTPMVDAHDHLEALTGDAQAIAVAESIVCSAPAQKVYRHGAPERKGTRCKRGWDVPMKRVARLPHRSSSAPSRPSSACGVLVAQYDQGPTPCLQLSTGKRSDHPLIIQDDPVVAGAIGGRRGNGTLPWAVIDDDPRAG
jgi:hypothetical protein